MTTSNAGVPTVRVRLFAILRELAGASEVEGAGSTVGEVVEGLAVRFGQRFGEVARAGSAVVDGERAEAGRRLDGSEELALLPPVSGGGMAG